MLASPYKFVVPIFEAGQEHQLLSPLIKMSRSIINIIEQFKDI